MPWYVFAAITPISYSIGIYISKFLVDKKIRNPLTIGAVSGILSGIIGLSLGLVIGFKYMGLYQTLLIIFGGMLLNWYLIPYFLALKIDDASRVIPLYQFVPVFTLVISTVFFKESLTIKQIVGMLIIIVAGLLLSLEKLDLRFLKPRKSFWLMLLSCIMYGMVGLLFRFVSKNASFWTIFTYEYIGVGIGGALLLSVPSIFRDFRKDMPVFKKSARLLVSDKLTELIAQMAEGYAVTLVAVPLVNIIGGIQPFIMFVLGYTLTKFFPHIIKENVQKDVVVQKVISIILIFIGLYFVYT